jgi:hypothetical protein
MIAVVVVVVIVVVFVVVFNVLTRPFFEALGRLIIIDWKIIATIISYPLHNLIEGRGQPPRGQFYSNIKDRIKIRRSEYAPLETIEDRQQLHIGW